LPRCHPWPMAFAMLGLLHARAAEAEEPGSVYRVHFAADGAITAAAALTWFAVPLVQPDLARKSCPCDASELPLFDRDVAGVRRDAFASASDVALIASYALGGALDGVQIIARGHRAEVWLEDALVMGEAIAINGAITQGFKLAFSRPRPWLYGLPSSSPELEDGSHYVSFYSGHTSGAFAALFSYAHTFALRNPEPAYRVAVYGGAAALAGTVGVLRVVSGKHFPSDVLAGALAGTAIGLVVPLLHARPRAESLSVRLLPVPSGVLFTVALTTR